MNALIEQSSKVYMQRVENWVDIALEEGVRFFVTSLGNPRWVVDKAAQVGGVVYHDVTERKWAQKAIDGGVHGLIAVNNVAGGHAGTLSPEALLDQLADLGLPVICAGGVGDPGDLPPNDRSGLRRRADGHAVHRHARSAWRMPTTSRRSSTPTPEDIVLTERLTGVPVAVINNDYIRRPGHARRPDRAVHAQAPEDEVLDAHASIT